MAAEIADPVLVDVLLAAGADVTLVDEVKEGRNTTSSNMECIYTA